MKFEGIYQKKEVVEEEWYLRVFVDEVNRMHFEAVNRDGFRIPGGVLFAMDCNGIQCAEGVNPKIGLALDLGGRIKVE